jgi:SRSO17 transposase
LKKAGFSHTSARPRHPAQSERIVAAFKTYGPVCKRFFESAGVPIPYRSARAKSKIALAELDRLIAAGVRLTAVLADAGYGMSAEFRQALGARGLAWAVASPVTRRSTRAT